MNISPSDFNTRAKAAGLHLANVGGGVISDLVKLCEGPVERIKGDWRSAPSKAPLKWMGVLIRHKLAEFNNGLYSVTQEGRDYLEKLRAAGLANFEETSISL